jgi:hypothetical protein
LFNICLYIILINTLANKKYRREEKMDLEKKRYWVFRHKPGKDSTTEEDCLDFVYYALKKKCVLMWYEYGIQEQKMVTQNWKAVQKLNEGDILLLAGNNRIYAVGKIIKPREDSKIVLNMKQIMEAHDHGEFRSDKSMDYIRFDDCPIFYEDLSDGSDDGWGQRVDVDSWRYFSGQGIEVKLDECVPGSSSYIVTRELEEKTAKEKIKKLEGAFMGKEAQLLLANKNLVLTGAPGTGKTFLVK